MEQSYWYHKPLSILDIFGNRQPEGFHGHSDCDLEISILLPTNGWNCQGSSIWLLCRTMNGVAMFLVFLLRTKSPLLFRVSIFSFLSAYQTKYKLLIITIQIINKLFSIFSCTIYVYTCILKYIHKCLCGIHKCLCDVYTHTHIYQNILPFLSALLSQVTPPESTWWQCPKDQSMTLLWSRSQMHMLTKRKEDRETWRCSSQSNPITEEHQVLLIFFTWALLSSVTKIHGVWSRRAYEFSKVFVNKTIWNVKAYFVI